MAKNTNQSLIINESQVLTDSLNVTDFNYFVSENKDLILFIFDESTNSFYNIKINLITFKQEIVNNVFISLDQLDFFHHKMYCVDLKNAKY